MGGTSRWAPQTTQRRVRKSLTFQALSHNQTGVFPLLQFHYSIFFFFFIEREVWVSVLVWPASLLESGGRCLALGFPGLCEAGPVEPDKWPFDLVRLPGQAEPSLKCDGGGRLWSINSKLQIDTMSNRTGALRGLRRVRFHLSWGRTDSRGELYI